MTTQKTRAKSYKMEVKQLRLKLKMMKAVLPLKQSGAWSAEEFENFCDGVLQG